MRYLWLALAGAGLGPCDGASQAPCAEGYTVCGAPDAAAPTETVDGGNYEYSTTCVDLSADPNNCGACGNVCATALPCVVAPCIQGTCGPPPPLSCTCSPDACTTNAECCSGMCLVPPPPPPGHPAQSGRCL